MFLATFWLRPDVFSLCWASHGSSINRIFISACFSSCLPYECLLLNRFSCSGEEASYRNIIAKFEDSSNAWRDKKVISLFFHYSIDRASIIWVSLCISTHTCHPLTHVSSWIDRQLEFDIAKLSSEWIGNYSCNGARKGNSDDEKFLAYHVDAEWEKS